MPTFKVEMRLHKSVTLTVEAESEEEIYDVLDRDDLDPDMYYKAKTFEDWNQGIPWDVKILECNPTADYVIGETRCGKDFIVKKESEWLEGVKK